MAAARERPVGGNRVDPQQFGGSAGFPVWPPPAPSQPPPAPPRRSAGRILAAFAVVILAAAAAALGLAVSGGAPAVDAGARPGSGAAPADVAARALWRTAPADRLLPPQLGREGTEAYYRMAVDTDESCARLPAAFRRALAPAGCVRLVQATYVDSTQSVVGDRRTGGDRRHLRAARRAVRELDRGLLRTSVRDDALDLSGQGHPRERIRRSAAHRLDVRHLERRWLHRATASPASSTAVSDRARPRSPRAPPRCSRPARPRCRPPPTCRR